jgi:hypothetical protein
MFVNGIHNTARDSKRTAMRNGLIVTMIWIFLAPAVIAETMREQEQKAALRKQLEIRLREANEKVSSLGGKASGIKEELKGEYQRRMTDLRKRQEIAGKKLAELGSARGLEWDRLKAETNAAIDDLNRAYDGVSSLLKGI